MPSPWDKPSADARALAQRSSSRLIASSVSAGAVHADDDRSKGGPTLESLAEEVRALRAEVAEMRAQQPLRSDVLVLPPYPAWAYAAGGGKA